MQLRLPSLAILLLAGISAWPAPTTGAVVEGTPPVDAFGIAQRYPRLADSIEWNSLHWSVGGARTLGGRDLPFDPTGWSQRRGSGTVAIDGEGRMRLGGTQPRLYINPYPDGSDDPSQAAQRFRNVEASVYFRRLSDAGAAYGGLVMGLRSGPLGHGSNGGDDCDATTYYARLRNDGNWDFAKELRHPNAAAQAPQPVWQGATLPLGQWIGMRFAVLTRADGQVALELWLDRSSEGIGGGDWALLGTRVDDGSWAADATGCTYPDQQVIDPGGGVVLLRNTADSDSGELSEYRWLSVREVDSQQNAALFADGFE
jgi:hypothetical protein